MSFLPLSHGNDVKGRVYGNIGLLKPSELILKCSKSLKLLLLKTTECMAKSIIMSFLYLTGLKGNLKILHIL